MKLGRRLQLLACHASHEIPQARRTQLLEELMRWLESEECSVQGEAETFWILMAGAGVHMEAYCEKVQAEIGGKILEQELAAPNGSKA